MEEKNTNVPVLALRGLTIFPNMLMHFDVERDISVKALEAAMENNQDILLVAQREIATEEPGQKDLYSVGTVSHIRLRGRAVRGSKLCCRQSLTSWER